MSKRKVLISSLLKRVSAPLSVMTALPPKKFESTTTVSAPAVPITWTCRLTRFTASKKRGSSGSYISRASRGIARRRGNFSRGFGVVSGGASAECLSVPQPVQVVLVHSEVMADLVQDRRPHLTLQLL